MTSALREGIALVRAGRWAEAHEIAQRDTSRLGSWLHGVVHWVEGDRANARYWYRQAGRSVPDPFDVTQELAALEGEAAP